MSHVEAEFRVISAMLGDIPRRIEILGARVAARDLENALEDVVSIFEASLRLLVRRFKKSKGVSGDDLDDFFKTKVRNGFQSIGFTQDFFVKEIGLDFFAVVNADELMQLKKTFEKRHPITHNLGIVDRAYLKKVKTAETEGRDVRLTNREISEAISMAQRCIVAIHPLMFPPPIEVAPAQGLGI